MDPRCTRPMVAIQIKRAHQCFSVGWMNHITFDYLGVASTIDIVVHAESLRRFEQPRSVRVVYEQVPGGWSGAPVSALPALAASKSRWRRPRCDRPDGSSVLPRPLES